MDGIVFLENNVATREGILEFLRRLGEPGVAEGIVGELGYDEMDEVDEDDITWELDLEQRAVEILARATNLDQHTTRRIITMLSFTASVAGDATSFITHNLARGHEDDWDEYNLLGMARSVDFSLGEEEPA